MQHMEAIEKIGDQIDKLPLIRSYTDLNGSDGLGTGFFLDHIFQQCPNLRKLRLQNFTLLHCDLHNLCINMSITHLVLNGDSITKDILTEISARLPSLKYVDISSAWQLEGFRQEDNLQWKLDMPHTSLKTLRLPFHVLVPTYFKLDLQTTCEYYHIHYQQLELLADSISSRSAIVCDPSGIVEYEKALLATDQQQEALSKIAPSFLSQSRRELLNKTLYYSHICIKGLEEIRFDASTSFTFV